MKATVSCKISDEDKRKLQEAADKRGITVNELLQALIRQHGYKIPDFPGIIESKPKKPEKSISKPKKPVGKPKKPNKNPLECCGKIWKNEKALKMHQIMAHH